MTSDQDILINRVKYLYMLNQIFNDDVINDHITHLKKCGEIKNIYTLDECNNYIKPSTIYIRVIKSLYDMKI